MKGIKKECREGWNSPVWSICTCSFLGALWIPCVNVRACSCSGNIRLLVPWGLGPLCKVSEHLTALSHVIFDLAPVNHHWWAHFFWPVTGTNACKSSLLFVSGSRLGLLDEVPSYQFVMLCAWHMMYVLCWGHLQCFWSFCYVVVGEKIIIVIL